jgi:hypothetical protein
VERVAHETSENADRSARLASREPIERGAVTTQPRARTCP